jgi:hypothetical protein
MHVKLYLSPSEATLLTQLANADRRSPEAVAEILLRFSLTQCQTVQSFRERLDSLPEQTPTQELTHERSVGKIDAIVDILKEAKRKQHPLSIDEIHDEMVRRCGSGSRHTVTAQLSRLPKERSFAVLKMKSGKEARFAAK